MLKSTFIGYRNHFTLGLTNWLSQKTDLQCVVWANEAYWNKNWKNRFKHFRRRMVRNGFFRTIDEILFFLYYRIAWQKKRPKK